jgi:hypothetical protein
MSYTFDGTTGDTFAQLQERVTFNSFSSTRYAEFVKRALNDAVTDICRKLDIQQESIILTYDSSGAVAAPTGSAPFWKVNSVWTVPSTAPTYPATGSSGETAFVAQAMYELRPVKVEDLRGLGHATSTLPLVYTVRRQKNTNTPYPRVAIDVQPAGSGGSVMVVGMTRPAIMDSDLDTTGLGADLDRAVMAYAKAQCFDNEDDAEMASYWRQQYRAELYDATTGGVGDAEPDVVEGAWGEWDC